MPGCSLRDLPVKLHIVMAQQVITDKHLIRIFPTVFGSLIVDTKQYPILSFLYFYKRKKLNTAVFSLCTGSPFSDNIWEQWALRTHPEHLNSDQKNPLAILLILLLFSRITKLEISTADLVDHCLPCRCT